MNAGPCPVCQSMADLEAEGPQHRRTAVSCKGCGRFEMTSTVEALLRTRMEDGDLQLRLRYWLRKAQATALGTRYNDFDTH